MPNTLNRAKNLNIFIGVKMINEQLLFEDPEIILVDEIKIGDLGFVNYFFSNQGYVSIIQQLALNYQKNLKDFTEISDFNIEKSICFIENIFVKEKYRGQGNGRQLLKELFQICLSEDIKEIYLVAKIQDHNFKLIDFYAKLGFEDLIDIDNTHFLLRKQF